MSRAAPSFAGGGHIDVVRVALMVFQRMGGGSGGSSGRGASWYGGEWYIA